MKRANRSPPQSEIRSFNASRSHCRVAKRTADAAGIDWKSAVYRKVQQEVKADRGLTIERMVELGRVSRSGFYRFQDAEPGPDRDMELRDAIQKIAVEWPSYG